MNKKEQELTADLQKWIKKYWDMTAVFEVKVSREKSLPYSAVKPHQVRALKTAGNKFIYKIPDLGGQNPCDLVTITEAPGYVVIFFYKPYKPKIFYMIEISQFEYLKATSKRKSITEEECQNYCYRSDVLK